MAKHNNDYQEARDRAKRVKSPWNLLHIPLTIAGVACCAWVFLKSIEFAAGVFGLNHLDLDFRTPWNDNDPHWLALVGLFFAALPLGLGFSNLVFWLIPFLRRIEDAEAVGYEGTDFRSAMKGLFVFAAFSIPLGLAESLLVILLRR